MPSPWLDERPLEWVPEEPRAALTGYHGDVGQPAPLRPLGEVGDAMVITIDTDLDCAIVQYGSMELLADRRRVSAPLDIDFERISSLHPTG